jgi:ribosomal protein S18 acetylase RimI-like enzyme
MSRTLTHAGRNPLVTCAAPSRAPLLQPPLKKWRVAPRSDTIDRMVTDSKPDAVADTVRPPVRRATRADVDAMAAQLAKTFWDDPVAQFIFRNAARREAGLRAFFRTQMQADYLPFGGCYTTDGYAGSAIWAPAGKPLLTGLKGVLTMVPVLPFVAGNLVTTLRVINFVERIHPHEPHWYLATLGTAVERQGKGIGSALMRPVLHHCDAEGIPCYLESSKQRNVPFYRRHGFEVVEEVQLPGDGPPLWTMWRQPRSM